MNKKIVKMVLAVAGILVGTGVAFNAAAALGNDPVGIVYDGIRNTANLSSGQLGMASNVVNVALMILIFFMGRHYINIGTFIYVIPGRKAVCRFTSGTGIACSDYGGGNRMPVALYRRCHVYNGGHRA